jgi:hypothetical protein
LIPISAPQSRRAPHKFRGTKLKTIKLKPTAPLSDARQRLAAMLLERAAILASIEKLQAAMSKLVAAQSAAAQPEAALASLDAVETRAASEWAMAGADGPAPQGDTARREELRVQLSGARIAVEAAARAYTGVAAAYADEAGKLARLAAPLRDVISEILVETTGPMIDEFKEENRKLQVKAVRLRKSLDVLAGMGDGPGNKPRAFGGLVDKIAEAFAMPGQDDEEASRSFQAWNALILGLHSDASVELEIQA